jgi:hypothetical protein
MPSISCACGNKLAYGEIPNPIEWRMISDAEFDQFAGTVDAEDVYKKTVSALRCDRCGRLWIYWDGFENEPVVYSVDRL